MDPKVAGFSKNQGQATLEITIALAATLAVFVGAFSVFWMEWRRLVCVKNLFETTHEVLISGDRPGTSALAQLKGFRIDETQEYVEVQALCGHSPERVRLYRLEPEPSASRSWF